MEYVENEKYCLKLKLKEILKNKYDKGIIGSSSAISNYYTVNVVLSSYTYIV